MSDDFGPTRRRLEELLGKGRIDKLGDPGFLDLTTFGKTSIENIVVTLMTMISVELEALVLLADEIDSLRTELSDR